MRLRRAQMRNEVNIFFGFRHKIPLLQGNTAEMCFHLDGRERNNQLCEMCSMDAVEFYAGFAWTIHVIIR